MKASKGKKGSTQVLANPILSPLSETSFTVHHTHEVFEFSPTTLQNHNTNAFTLTLSLGRRRTTSTSTIHVRRHALKDASWQETARLRKKHGDGAAQCNRGVRKAQPPPPLRLNCGRFCTYCCVRSCLASWCWLQLRFFFKALGCSR